MSILRQRMIEDLQIRNYSPKTIDTYIDLTARFARYFGKSPDVLGPEHIRRYQVFLVKEKRVSWTKFNQTVCALRFLYRITLRRSWAVEHIPFPKGEKRLPVVLDVGEVGQLLSAVDNLKHRTVLMSQYSAGLRIAETLSLKVPDVDSRRMLLRIEQGKGKKDRYASLSPSLLTALREYWKIYRPTSWLFPGRSPDKPLRPGIIQRVCAQAAKKAGIAKPVHPHTLRHCFATHLLEAGTNLRTIQLLMGHRGLNTTAQYLHIARTALQLTDQGRDLLAKALPAK